MVGLSWYYKNAPSSLNEGVSWIMMAQNYENTVGKANNNEPTLWEAVLLLTKYVLVGSRTSSQYQH